VKLYFLRHGIAVDSADWNGSERDRPLTGEGRDKMALVAKAMAKLGIEPAVILTSPLVRARQTAEIAAEALKCGSLRSDERLANGFDIACVAEMVHEHEDADSLMFVGHEPTMSATVGALVGGAQIALKKGGLALVEIPDPSSLSGELLWLAPPKVLIAR